MYNPNRDLTKLLEDVQEEHAFILNNGGTIKNLQQLYTCIQSMTQKTFNHHVNESKNDFENWIRHVHKDYKLANNFSSAKNKNDFLKYIKDRIYEIEKLSEKNKTKVIKMDDTNKNQKKDNREQQTDEPDIQERTKQLEEKLNEIPLELEFADSDSQSLVFDETNSQKDTPEDSNSDPLVVSAFENPFFFKQFLTSINPFKDDRKTKKKPLKITPNNFLDEIKGEFNRGE